jgi:hypothetical protein
VEVPAEAIPFTAPRDSIIHDLLAIQDTLVLALTEQRSVAKRLRNVNAILVANVARLEGVLEAYPKPRSALWPTLGAGLFAGACSDLRVCSGAGITLTWKLAL